MHTETIVSIHVLCRTAILSDELGYQYVLPRSAFDRDQIVGLCLRSRAITITASVNS